MSEKKTKPVDKYRLYSEMPVKTKTRPKDRHDETREEKERRWFVRDAEHYLSQLRSALLSEDWAASRQQCGEILDLIDRKEGGRP